MMILKRCVALLLLLCLPALALRPKGNFGGNQQLDIEKLEKDLGHKFSIPFPAERYDIDYFYKGDLLLVKYGDESVLVSCPFVVVNQLSLAFGSGNDRKSYKMVGNLNVSWTKDFKRASIYIMTNVAGEETPGVKERPSQKEDETLKDFYERVEKFWLQRVADQKTKITVAQVKAAFKVMAVALKQKPELKISKEVKDPTLEKEFQGK